jgi:hypothetical protein
VDTHVTNGTDHQHVLTLISTQHNKLDGELGEYLENTFESEIFQSLNDKNRAPIVYVNVHGGSPNEGWTQFWDAARYSSGYTSLFQTLGFISESHMWKPYKERVENTYDYLETMIMLTAKNGGIIQEKRKNDRQALLESDSLATNWEINKGKFRMVTLKGFKSSMPTNSLTGNPLLHYDRNQPIEKEVPFYNEYAITNKVKVPNYYVIPQAWGNVIERLTANGVQFTSLKKDSLMRVEGYRIEAYQTAKTAYEGHYLHFGTTISSETKQIKFRKGDIMVPTKQLSKKYLVEVLEPSSQDSFFNWNFFDTILQQKERFSDYVFAEKAKEILVSLTQKEQDAFYKMQQEDEAFANSNYAQLDWIYKRSVYYEKAHLAYPVYRYFIND